ncbi:uncharacterized protein LOC121403126 [Xenopus laevis]|uniref:Uncharacterized protein LOC121403126 n=1 Tax=Xenopus laevis TaxID=8355 RepID=A0A8J1MY67_XENLA|nr:uncharacterized protein LOC121403126 [Xenopus laevis]
MLFLVFSGPGFDCWLPRRTRRVRNAQLPCGPWWRRIYEFDTGIGYGSDMEGLRRIISCGASGGALIHLSSGTACGESSRGKNLGFSGTRVIWRGISGMRWLQVLPEVVRFSRAYDGPLVLVIHAGGNDLCQVRVAEFISLIKSDMVRFPPFFMDLVVVWSELVPRLAWRGARNVAAVDRSRTLLNQRISRFVRSQGWVVVRHRQLETDTPLLADGVHLNEAGLDIFLSGLRDGVGRAISLLGGGRSSV